MGNNNAIRVPAGSPTVWSRPPPPHFSYQPFAPIDLQGHRDLSQGFPHMPPPSNEQPHPFASHDVCQVDWEWFLGDLKWEAMRLDTQEGHSEAPRETRRPHPRGLIGVAISLAVGAATASSSKPTTNPMAVNVNSCAQRVDQWNQYFFNPRRMQVVLVKGRAARGRSSSRDSSSSSSSNDSGRRSHRRSGTSNRLERKLERIEERHQRRMAKLARREERREERRERRARRRGQLGADEGRYEGREESHKVWWVSVVPV
ncbi:hypothetical protein PLICRDRAFT_502251 [Plicaturopsis crispa FD-325 SS-3]|nr:hypothetical protein PLICRDRAFT_502251 [Plicaturopsis crispa FD-325 SS-3]